MGTIAFPGHVTSENLGTHNAVDQKKGFSDLLEPDEQSKLTTRSNEQPLMVSPEHTVTMDGQPTQLELVTIDSAETAPSTPQQPNPTADDTAIGEKNPPAVNVGQSETLRSLNNISKILVSVAVAVLMAICTGQLSPKLYGSDACDWTTFVVISTQNVAVLMMILGMYQQVRNPRLSRWLQSIGHLLCLEGFIFMQALFMKLPLKFIAIPLIVVAAALAGAIMSCE